MRVVIKSKLKVFRHPLSANINVAAVTLGYVYITNQIRTNAKIFMPCYELNLKSENWRGFYAAR